MRVNQIRPAVLQKTPQPPNAFRPIAQATAIQTRYSDAQRLDRLFPMHRARKCRYHLDLKAAPVQILQNGIQKALGASRPESIDQMNDARSSLDHRYSFGGLSRRLRVCIRRFVNSIVSITPVAAAIKAIGSATSLNRGDP